METKQEQIQQKVMNFWQVISLMIKGGLMGIANVIPGVSGGTMALVLGIFDRLIGSLKSIGSRTIKVGLRFAGGFWKKGTRQELLDELKRIDAVFLLIILLGAGLAIAGTAKLISFLVEHHTAPTLAFFIGLIIPSIAIPLRMMKQKGMVQIFWILMGILITVGISLILQYTSAATALGQSDNLLLMSGVMLFCGFIAISAMILPGLSGSYVLMLMGQYFFVMSLVARITDFLTSLGGSTVVSEELTAAFIYIAVFAIGCVLGLMFFARLLNFLLERFHSSTMGFLVGLVLGSFFILWPFKGLPPNAELAQMAKDTAIFTQQLDEKLDSGTITDEQYQQAVKQRKSEGEYLPRSKWLPAAQNVLPSSEEYQNELVGGETDDLLWSLLALGIGLLLSLGIIRLGKE